MKTFATLSTIAIMCVGCESDPSSAKKEFHHMGNEKMWLDENEARSARSTAEHQAMLGAQRDPTLYACHFDGTNLNSLGKAKLDAMIVNGGVSKIYIDTGKADGDAHLAAVNAYLAAADRADGSIAIESGAAPGNTSPAAPAISRMYKTETPDQSTATNESSATTAGTGKSGN
jgi:hypothetical protein